MKNFVSIASRATSRRARSGTLHLQRCSGTAAVTGAGCWRFDTGVCLPSESAMFDAEQRHVIASIAEVPRSRKRGLETETSCALATATMTERMIRV